MNSVKKVCHRTSIHPCCHLCGYNACSTEKAIYFTISLPIQQLQALSKFIRQLTSGCKEKERVRELHGGLARPFKLKLNVPLFYCFKVINYLLVIECCGLQQRPRVATSVLLLTLSARFPEHWNCSLCNKYQRKSNKLDKNTPMALMMMLSIL